jgi:hypothetical protein
MGRTLAALLVMALPVVAGEAVPGCAWLCGNWALDAAQGEPAEPLIDKALEDYEEPRERDRDRLPSRAALRAELLALLAPPPTLTLAEQGEVIVVRVPGQAERRFAANRPHSRTSDAGESEIRTTWRADDSLLISETWNRRRNQAESYALQRDGTLVVNREVERPGIKKVRTRSMYRRA